MNQQIATAIIGISALLYAVWNFAPSMLRARWQHLLRARGAATVATAQTTATAAKTPTPGCNMGCSGCTAGGAPKRNARFAGIAIAVETNAPARGACGAPLR